MRHRSNGDWRLDCRMRVIAGYLEVLEFIRKQGVRTPADDQPGQGSGSPRQLQPRLFEMIVVQMNIATGPDEVAHLVPADTVS